MIRRRSRRRPRRDRRCANRGPAPARGPGPCRCATSPEHLQNARMPARIVGGALAVRCADRGARHVDGCDAGALLGAVREVGGDGNRRGWHDLVAVLGCPALPRGPPRAVGAGGVRGAGRFERSGDARLVGGADGRRGAAPAS